jgi:hypothetical protein
MCSALRGLTPPSLSRIPSPIVQSSNSSALVEKTFMMRSC